MLYDPGLAHVAVVVLGAVFGALLGAVLMTFLAMWAAGRAVVRGLGW